MSVFPITAIAFALTGAVMLALSRRRTPPTSARDRLLWLVSGLLFLFAAAIQLATLLF